MIFLGWLFWKERYDRDRLTPVPGRVIAGVSVWFLYGSSKVPVCYHRETIRKPKKKDGSTPALVRGRAGGHRIMKLFQSLELWKS